MKLETFFEKFDQFADAPDAVAKMRELVLELAVQGKLVEQKPAEDDGHALLKLLHKKNPPSLAEVDGAPMDSELASFPSSWAPSRLGEVAEIIRGVTFPGSAKSETRSNGDVACLRTASVQAEIDWDDLIYISPTHVSREDQWVMPNDIMISMANSYALVGKVAIVRQVPQKATFGAFLAAIRPILIEPYFLLYVLRSPRMQAAFRASSSQTTNIANISLGRMRPLPFPLPPLAEQKRIVAKVDELMALCDRLEAQQQERETRHAALARASLARFADAPTPANLPFLFHPSYAIPPVDLRKSILTLAVQGKLVPQDPNDEPAGELFARIEGTRERLIKKRTIKRVAVEPNPSGEACELLPPGWLWTRLGNTFDVRDGTHDTPKYTTEGFPLITSKNIYSGSLLFDGTNLISEEDHRQISERSRVDRGDILFAMIGSIGNPVIVDTDREFSIKNVALFKYYAAADSEPRFLLLYLKLVAEEMRARAAGGVQSFVSLGFLRNYVFPLPPLAEQRRIVTKVEQLMALVDALEMQLAASRTKGTDLMEAVVAELTVGA